MNAIPTPEARALADAIARDDVETERLQAECSLDLENAMVKIEGRWLPVPQAMHRAATWLLDGRVDEAKAIAQATVEAIAEAALLHAIAESAKVDLEDDADDYPPPEPEPDPDLPALWGVTL